MKKQLLIAIKILALMTVLLGVIYPTFVMGIGHLFFKDKANGSLIIENGKTVGSELLGQQMDDLSYFNPRPSVNNYNTMPSGASNLGLTSKQLREVVSERQNNFIRNNRLPANANIPSEMLFASGSGLDPHISPEAASLQIERIAKQRKFDTEQSKKLTDLAISMTQEPQFGIFGNNRINILLLNLELDKIK